METIRVNTSQNIDIDYEVAGLGERILARLIDIAIFIVLFFFFLIIMIISKAEKESKEIWIGFLIVIGILYTFYDLLCEIFMNGQSIGKRVLKIRVISLDGARATIGQYLLRWLFRIVDFGMTMNMGAIICVAVSENKQRIGDMVAGTTLIKTQTRTRINQLTFIPPVEYEPVFPQAIQLSDQDIALAQEVINNFIKSRNNMLVYNMAIQIQNHLNIKSANMNEMVFLQTIIKDYHYLSSQIS